MTVPLIYLKKFAFNKFLDIFFVLKVSKVLKDNVLFSIFKIMSNPKPRGD